MNTDSIQEANVKLNDTYSDQEIEILPLWNDAIINTTLRPSQYFSEPKQLHSSSNKPNMQSVFNTIFTKLNNLYGIQINTITDKELAQKNWEPEIQTTNAFIKDGNIYINTDHAKADAPIHELTHLLLGSVRFKNPDIYFKIVESAQQFPNFQQFQQQNPNRAMNDILEEAFVTEMSKYLAGEKSIIEQLPQNVIYELHYNIKRLLDSAFMGQYSVKSIPNSQLYNLSLSELTTILNSNLLESNFSGSLDEAMQHRILANTKEELIKKGDLREECE